MQDINPPTGDNLGGLASLAFIPVTYIASIPDPVDHEVKEAVVLHPGKQWFNAYATEDTMSFLENSDEDLEGMFFEPKLELFVPKGISVLAALFKEMKLHQYIVDCFDNNNVRRLIGTLDSPLDFKYKYNSRTKTTGLNGYTLTFFGQTIEPAPSYNPA